MAFKCMILEPVTVRLTALEILFMPKAVTFSNSFEAELFVAFCAFDLKENTVQIAMAINAEKYFFMVINFIN